jgi:aryl-alcohol dehydrogenase-like predicted oxidoreductase
MEHRQLGRAGLKVSRLTLGAMTFGDSRTFMKGVTSSDDEAERVLDAAIDAGIDLIDTADVYSEGRSEELLGRHLGGRRRKVLLGHQVPVRHRARRRRPQQQGLSRHHIVSSVEQSLRRLRTDTIDLFQTHMQDRAVPIEETLRALRRPAARRQDPLRRLLELHRLRLVESLWAADRRNTARYDSVQLQWSLVSRDCEREVIPASRRLRPRRPRLEPARPRLPLGQVPSRRTAAAGTRLESWKDTWPRWRRSGHWATLDVVRAIADRRGATPASVSVAWLLSRPELTSVIIGARTVAQLRDNLAALELQLEATEIAALDKASEPDWGYPYDFIKLREAW